MYRNYLMIFLFAVSLFACGAAENSDTSEGDGSVALEGCGANTDCSSAEYCQFSAGSCGAQGERGACVPRPEMCTMQYAPVCGCDGKTHGNDCVAAGQGVSVRINGECPKAN
jgi:hypothetical protein